MATKHIITRGYGFADGTKFIPTRGYGFAEVAPEAPAARRSRRLQHIASLRFDLQTGRWIPDPMTPQEIENEILALFLAE